MIKENIYNFDICISITILNFGSLSYISAFL